MSSVGACRRTLGRLRPHRQPSRWRRQPDFGRRHGHSRGSSAEPVTRRVVEHRTRYSTFCFKSATAITGSTFVCVNAAALGDNFCWPMSRKTQRTSSHSSTILASCCTSGFQEVARTTSGRRSSRDERAWSCDGQRAVPEATDRVDQPTTTSTTLHGVRYCSPHAGPRARPVDLYRSRRHAAAPLAGPPSRRRTEPSTYLRTMIGAVCTLMARTKWIVARWWGERGGTDRSCYTRWKRSRLLRFDSKTYDTAFTVVSRSIYTASQKTSHLRLAIILTCKIRLR